ncbi:putative response regulatory protein [Clostridium tepidiprofundi DSM 19306]|uniref:Stage 0 sporulation protein A homolog n=1 Tax=Clostridium tepidiprofundi DSM 19306 TaxID=1121338 RepID=A0A151B245_9CLOT|nr:response regulator [Clostridium tepidiprofundi]KYH33985.1 putative response regulatory protein [Clostridium tepidiprofundi DSM 19306]
MLKVMVVDDEYLDREGMKKTIDWASLGCVFSGEAKDGYEGIELAKIIKPNIVITDISMPRINGLEMANKIKEFLPECKFIIITGYDDFEYAKAAVKINAIDFILKPVDENELIDSIKNISYQFERNIKRKHIAREKILLDIMRGKIRGKESIDKIKKEYSIEINDLCIVCIENDYYEKALESDSFDVLFSANEYAKELICERLSQYTYYLVECHDNIFAILISMDNVLYPKSFRDIFIDFQKKFSSVFSTTVTIGVSNVGSIYDIKKVYEESKQALKNKLYSGNNSINYFMDLKKENIVKWSYIISFEKELRIVLKAGDRTKIRNKLDNLYIKFFTSNHISNSIIKQISIDIILIALKTLSEYNISIEEVMGKNFDIYRKIENYKTIKQMHNLVSDIIFNVFRCIKLKNATISENSIDKAIQYINEHYNENISLSDVSKNVYLSESYICRKIKSATGMSFVEYITKLRMEKAIEYLQNPNYKIVDIAKKLGYSDYRYFSRIFKKYTGYSPSDWK